MTADPKPHVVVSLTSFPAAIPYAIGAIRAILRGSVLPDRLVLYLTFSQFGEEGIPEELLELEKSSDIFEIRNYDRDIRSYRKLVPALSDFPDSVIITIDDDVDYHVNLVRDLLGWHSRYPDAVIANRVKLMKPGLPYRKWRKYRWYHFLTKRIQARFDNIQTGVGGVLYPPHALKREMIDVDLFTKVAPTTDDIWFWAATVANGVKILPVPFGHNKPKGLKKPKSLSLKTTNFKGGTDLNAEALAKILALYPEVRQRVMPGMCNVNE